MTATVPGTTAGPPVTTATVPTTTTTTTTVPVTTETTGFCTGCGAHHSFHGSVSVEINRRHPVAGKTFKGLTISKVTGGGTISWVRCDAEIAGKRLHARQQSFFAGPHQRTKVVCRWRIPADAGGKRLRPWRYGPDGQYTFVVHIWPDTASFGRHVGAWGITSWTVKR